MDQMMTLIRDSFFNEFQTTMTGDRIAIGLLVSFFVALFVVLIYRLTYQGVAFSRSFSFSLVLLSMITSLVIMTVTTNLTLSLGMVGALSIVRFRTAVKDPNDTIFMFWAISAGIMSGAGLLYITLISNLSLGVLYLVYFYIARKSRTAPYLIVVRYQNAQKDVVEDAIRSLNRMKIKSKTVSSDVTELCVETRLTEQLMPLIDSLAAVDGVIEASAVSFRGETTL